MNYQAATILEDADNLPKLPGWVTPSSGETPQNVAFLSGASFATLDSILVQSGSLVPRTLLANTLALKAAVATSKIEGRMAREADIRDAFHLTPVGDAKGPDGEMLAFWGDTTRVRLKRSDWQDQLKGQVPEGFEDEITGLVTDSLEAAQMFGPMAGATKMLKSVLAIDVRAERLACQFADIVLARFFGWCQPMPLVALHLTKAQCRAIVDGAGEAELSVQNSILKAVQTTILLARKLTRRAEALRAIAPKLRAKGSDEAVALFLTECAVAPSDLTEMGGGQSQSDMSPRAARRFCDRLVELGVVKELTGRSSFRLYGISP